MFYTSCFVFLKGALGVAVQWLIIKFTTDHMCFLRKTLMANYLNMSYEDYLRGKSSDYVYDDIAHCHLLFASFTSSVASN